MILLLPEVRINGVISPSLDTYSPMNKPGLSQRISMEYARDHAIAQEIVASMCADDGTRVGHRSLVGRTERCFGTSVEFYAHRQRQGVGNNGDATVVDLPSTGRIRLTGAIANYPTWSNDGRQDFGFGTRLASKPSQPPSVFSSKPFTSVYLWSTAGKGE
jgi:hypothetical protein